MCGTNFKKSNLPCATYVKRQPETLEHFLFDCSKIKIFWKDLETILDDKLTFMNFDIRDIIFGIINLESNIKLINYIILESKYFIHFRKLKNKPLSRDYY